MLYQVKGFAMKKCSKYISLEKLIGISKNKVYRPGTVWVCSFREYEIIVSI
jgi:hypothetical protein